MTANPDPGPVSPSRIRRALVLSLLNTAVGRVGTLLTGIVLARLLAPEDFGVFAVALVTLNGLLAINEMGVSLALVRWKGDPAEIAPTVTTISIASSIVMYVLCWFAAPSVASILGAPAATPVVRLLCVAVLIDGLTAAATQFVNREFKQGTRLGVDLFNLLLTTGVTIVLALGGDGAWSLAWGRIAGNAVSALLLFRLVSMWPRPGFNRTQARHLMTFGLPLAGASLLVFAMLNVDFIVAGHVLGAVALGFYLQAFNLSSWPVNMFSTVVRRVSLAAFSDAQDDAALREERLVRLFTLLAVVTLPVCVLMGLLAEPLVVFTYGEKWRGAVYALQFLVVLGAVRVAGELTYDYLVSLGLTAKTMWVQGTWFAALCVALPIGAMIDGIRGIAIAHALVGTVLVLPLYFWLVRRTGVRIRTLIVSLKRPVLGCGLLTAVLLLVRAMIDPFVLQLLVGGLVGGVAYLVVVWPLSKELRAGQPVNMRPSVAGHSTEGSQR